MTATSETGESRTRRRWPIAVAVLGAVVVAAGLVAVWWVRDGGAAAARRAWQPPPNAVLSSPMRAQPIAGWRTSVADLGLPAPDDGAEQSRIAASNDPFGPQPFIGNLGDRAYFLASSPATPGPRWWVVGIDVRDGRSLFAPAALGATARPPQCFLNGSANVLCLNENSSQTAWVVDASSGTVSYSGPTDLRLGYAKLAVKQVGVYAVAETEGQGVYGIGPRAETTWFVPGDGRVQPGPSPRFEPAPQALATQLGTNPRAYEMTVFSVGDGKVVTPEVQDGAHLEMTEVYPGGFASHVQDGHDSLGVQFFDDTGKRLDGRGVEGSLTGAPGLPIISSQSTDQSSVFSPDGEKLLDIPDGATRIVGTTLFVNENKSDDFPMWRQYDLKTGTEGPACDFNMSNYVGTDGSVIVFEVTNRKAGLVARARDLATCDTLWTLPSQPHSLGRVWRVNTTLVQLSDDGTELSSLVAPN